MSSQANQAPLVLLVLTLGFGVVAGPFLMGSADSWDMVGHLAHAEMQRDMFPQMVFWNPYFYTGYEQFTAYPPLLSLLVAVLSFPLGLVAAFKLVTAVSWIALPAALYFMYRGLLDAERALLGTAITALLLILVQQQIGGTFFSTLVVGNVANCLGLVLFLVCLGFILRNDFRRAIPVLALLIITHMIAAVVMSLFVGWKLLLERRGWVLFLGYGMAAFWLIPALLDTYRDVSTHDDYPLTLLEYALYVGLLLGFVLYRRRSQDRRFDSLVLALATLFFLVGILRHLSPELWQAIPMHFHRVKIYSLVVMVPVLLGLIPPALKWDPKSRVGSVLLPVVGLVTTVIIVVVALGMPHVLREPWEPPTLEVEGTRVLTVEEIPEVPYWHNFRHHLASVGHLVGKGLFIEASRDAPFLLSLEQNLDQEHQVPLRWGIDWDSRIMADPEMEARTPFLLDVFGIQAIVSDRPLISAAGGPSDGDLAGYAVIERRHQPLVDVPRYPIKFSGGPLDNSDWQALTHQWFRSSDELLVVDANPFEVSGSGSAKLTDTHRHFNSLDILVAADEPVPVYVRMGHSSKWHAYTGDRELPVHRVTPNNMLVLAEEDFELRYEPLNEVNWVGLLVSILSLLGYGILILRSPR